MYVELEASSQITLPSELTKRMGIREGDKFEVMERDGGVFLCPVVVYPHEKLVKITKIISEHKKDVSVVYDNVEDMYYGLGIELEEEDV